MISSQPIVLMIVVALVAVNAESFFSRRRNAQQPFQRFNTNSNFRQRLGTQGANNYPLASPLQQPQSTGNSRDLATTNYAGAAAYDGHTSNYGTGYDNREGSINPLSALVAPLAALALLGAAVAVASNPVLMTLAVLSSGRKRRAVSLEKIGRDDLTAELQSKLHEMETLEKYIVQVPEQEKQQKKLMATYLSCSGFTESSNSCLDRVVCDYSIRPGKMTDLEKDVISIILYNIMSNGYVSQEYKERLRTAAQYGRSRGQCSAFICDQLN